MTHEMEYKGIRITVWAEKVKATLWTWKFRAGDLPPRRNDGNYLNSEAAAVDEAFGEAKSLIDRTDFTQPV